MEFKFLSHNNLCHLQNRPTLINLALAPGGDFFPLIFQNSINPLETEKTPIALTSHTSPFT
jgi:hypothetical protein